MLVELITALTTLGVTGTQVASLVGVAGYAAIRRRAPSILVGFIISIVVTLVVPLGDVYRREYNKQVTAQLKLGKDFAKGCAEKKYDSIPFLSHCIEQEASLLAWPSVAAAGVLVEKGFWHLTPSSTVTQILWYGTIFSALIALYGMYYKGATAARCVAAHEKYEAELHAAGKPLSASAA